MPHRPPNRPYPDDFTPPKGAWGSSATDWSLMCTMPVRTRRAKLSPWVAFSVMMPQVRPLSVSLAMATAVSSSPNVSTTQTGPKASA